MSEEKQEKKIIVDDDWKAQAQQEKEELAKEQETEKEAPQQGERPALPDADFTGLVSMLATQAFYAMGLFATQEGETPAVDLEMAKFNIDMIGVIEEKTKGNLEDGEKELLKNILHQLRMTYVKVSQGA